jgi:exopolyphosphatase/guanosine-5'-triphosphate,3'-diphosphate pyrophosphatase
MARVACIDIGTNSVLLLVAEANRAGELLSLTDRATITRLGQGVDRHGVLAPEAVERTADCLAGYASIARSHGVERIEAVATSAMRDARGGEAFLDRAEALLGVRPRVISGELEAQLTFEGALTGLDLDGPVAVFDVGGGSTELIVGNAADARVEQAVSLDVGAVRLTERHVASDPPSQVELEAVREAARAALAAAPDLAGRPLIGVAGTVTTLAAVALDVTPYDGEAVHGARLERSVIVSTLAALASETLAERRTRRALDPRRADVIVAGAVLVDAICEHAGVSELRVSDRGVRWGLARAAIKQLAR